MVQTTSAVALSDKTIERANVIAKSTGSLEIGLLKSVQVELLLEKLHNSICHFVYIKKSTGELREAWGTLAHNLVSAKVKGCQRRNNPNCICYYDVERGEFRSLLLQNLVKVY
jgi:hypothetical protein